MSRAKQFSGMSAVAVIHTSRSSEMFQQVMSEALARERVHVSEEQVRRVYLRRLAVLRRRQRRVDAARRALHSLSI